MNKRTINRPVAFTLIFVTVILLLVTLMVAMFVQDRQDLTATKKAIASTASAISPDDESVKIWRENSCYYIITDERSYIITDETVQNQIDSLIDRQWYRHLLILFAIGFLFIVFLLYISNYEKVAAIQAEIDENRERLEQMKQYNAAVAAARIKEERLISEIRKNAQLYDWATEPSSEPIEIQESES